MENYASHWQFPNGFKFLIPVRMLEVHIFNYMQRLPTRNKCFITSRERDFPPRKKDDFCPVHKDRYIVQSSIGYERDMVYRLS